MHLRSRLFRRVSALAILLGSQIISFGQDSSKSIVKAKPHTFGVIYDVFLHGNSNMAKAEIVTIEYSNKSKIPYAVRINAAGRFGTTGLQIEADAYPKINKKTYAYINVGAADDILFPQYRAGLSLYRSLPGSFEMEGGFRLLHFQSNVWIYTASLSKYYKKYLFNISTFLTPENGYILRSYFFKTRYYFKEKSYLMLTIGTGISPDDKQNANQLFTANKVRSKRADVSTRIFIKHDNIIFLNAGFMNQRTQEKESTDRVNFTIGYHKVF